MGHCIVIDPLQVRSSVLFSTMLRVYASFHRACLVSRGLCSSAPIVTSSPTVLTNAGVSPPPRPAYQTHELPIYSLPYYDAPESALTALSIADVSRVLKAYGALLRKKDTVEERRERLYKITRDRLTISGSVVSDKMDKSIVVAARRRAFVKKVQKEYAVTRRFKAHDEENLCREGDRVTIRSCRPLSKSKNHVVVRNYGDKARIGHDDRASILEQRVMSTEPVPLADGSV